MIRNNWLAFIILLLSSFHINAQQTKIYTHDNVSFLKALSLYKSEQYLASQAMFEALGNSLWLGFLVAFTAGVGEELLFRGALQPIFGNLIVSIFFVMMHSQYILTPASLIILLVSLVFGFLRTYYTTPSAMMAHFVYNFTPFVIITILVNAGFPMEAIIF